MRDGNGRFRSERSIEKGNQFMSPYVYRGDLVEYESIDGGTGFVPLDSYDYIPEEMVSGSIEVHRDVFYGRLSADGYMDCVDWVMGTSEEDVLDQLEEMYGF